MNFKETFLHFTEYTTPFKSETDFEEYLMNSIPNLVKDQIGNYHKIIGTPTTMFTCHLDNYCKEKVKVNHVITDNIIATDEESILGADNKAGVITLLYLIENNVPGHYCFFVGEEPILSGGCWGSSLFAQYYSSQIVGIKRAVAFDRKQKGSIITRQMAQPCCSNEFAEALKLAFIEQGVPMELDTTGYYTDTSSFMELVSECTNVSIGVWGEHTKKEYVDIEYVEVVAKAAAKINWESLPSIREPKWIIEENYTEANSEGTPEEAIFCIINSNLSQYNFMCVDRSGFRLNKAMIFSHWFRDFQLEVNVFVQEDGVGAAVINGIMLDVYDTEDEEDQIDQEQLKLCLTSLMKLNYANK